MQKRLYENTMSFFELCKQIKRLLNEPTAATLAYDIEKTVFEVMATNGDTALCGDDFDHELLKYIGNEFKESIGSPKLKEIAEKAKIELSSATKTDLSIANSSGPKHLDMELIRAKFESLVDKLIQKTIPPFAENFFGKILSKSVNPDEVVAMGATIQGDVIGGKLDGIVLIDVTQLLFVY
ncbi:heat shock protein Hsp70 [Reticulomyxa filosa]|uniref:Heat shock protein Hsp70 n=1 Tax=Reticulomyxa filosa TaxID=46433 RepID=X6LTA5_RETFI|nr:heat shock protein Hsp70 [Reticulomyxa filosa]|eukprot:ETO04621.1 heat shock protein Hsp70 [Reticulomyxa filosa]